MTDTPKRAELFAWAEFGAASTNTRPPEPLNHEGFVQQLRDAGIDVDRVKERDETYVSD